MYNKGTHKQNKKITYRKRENICRQCNQQGLISKIYKPLIQLNITKTNNLIKIWAEDLNRHFSTDRQTDRWLKAHMKRCSTSLIIREMHNRTIMRCHLTPVRKAILKSLQIINAKEDVEKREPSILLVGI